jgi:hypothetical protein
MIVIGGSTKALNQTRNLYLACLLLIFGLAACSGSEPISTPTAQQTELLAPQSSQLDVDLLSDLDLKPSVATEELLALPALAASPAPTELDQSILKSLSKLSQIQDLSIEASSVRELALLSAADRQTLQALAAQQTMTAAEQLAAKQVDDAAQRTPRN